jgi:hypothetical protein
MKWQQNRPANERAGPPALSAAEPGVGDGAEATESPGIVGFLPSSWRRDWLFGLFLVVATLIAYLPSLRYSTITVLAQRPLTWRFARHGFQTQYTREETGKNDLSSQRD